MCFLKDSRRALRSMSTDALNKGAGIEAKELGVRTGSLAPRENHKPRDARRIVFGREAVNEVAKFACRRNAEAGAER